LKTIHGKMPKNPPIKAGNQRRKIVKSKITQLIIRSNSNKKINNNWANCLVKRFIFTAAADATEEVIRMRNAIKNKMSKKC